MKTSDAGTHERLVTKSCDGQKSKVASNASIKAKANGLAIN